MLHPSIEINLISRLHLLQYLLRPMSLLRREYRIRLRGTNRQWSLHIPQLILLHEARVRAVPDVYLRFAGQKVADDVFRTEAVSYRPQFGDVVFGAELDDARVDDRVDGWGEVRSFVGAVFALHPLWELEAVGPVEGDGVAGEEVRHGDEVAVGGELVGEELGVYEGVADHVGDEDDRLGWVRVVWGKGEVRFDWKEGGGLVLDCALR